MTQFTKPATDTNQQIAHLRGQGIAIADEARARHYLRAIGYYRLSGYAYPFRLDPPPAAGPQYQAGTSFDEVLGRYVCDREMRVHVMDAIERIEVGVRTAISNHMSVTYGPHWFTDPNRFLPAPVAGFNHADFLTRVGRECSKSSEAFITHYLKTYTRPSLPPSWMIMETLSIGTISKLLDNLPRTDRTAVAATIRIDGGMRLSEKVLGSWLNSLTELRNTCAHHGRLLLRVFKITGVEPKAFKGSFWDPTSLYPRAVVLHLLLRALAPDSHWKDGVMHLFNRHPQTPPGLYGFPPDWQQRPEWQAAPFAWPAR